MTASSSLGGGQNFALGGDYRLEITLHGVISNVFGAPWTLNPDNSVTTGLGSNFDVELTSGIMSLFDNTGGNLITNLTFLSGDTSGIQLVDGSFNADITLNTLLGGANCTPGTCDPYILTGSGGTLAGTGLELFAITTGSARITDGTSGRPAPFAGSNFTTHSLVINFQDNGDSTTFSQVPEPASLALMGIGLLGFGAIRRRKKFA